MTVSGVPAQIPRIALSDSEADPQTLFSVDQEIDVRVTEIDPISFFLGLTMREEDDPAEKELEHLIAAGESKTVEFKSTLRRNTHTGESDPKMEIAVLKNIVAMLNTDGGRVIVGLRDDKEPIGIAADNFPDSDKMMLHLRNLVNKRIGEEIWDRVHPQILPYKRVELLVVQCDQSARPVFLDRNDFFIRQGPAASVLRGNDMMDYVESRKAALADPEDNSPMQDAYGDTNDC